MNKKYTIYVKLFLSTFYLSAFTFGGGYVIVPLMRKRFVNKYKWIDEKEMMDFIAIAQSSPGPIAVNTSILIGYRLAGLLGAFITVLGTILPPLIIVSLLTVAYTALQDNVIVRYILRGMQAGVAAIIIDVIIDMVKEIWNERNIILILIMLASLVAVLVFKVNIIFIIICSAIVGVFSMFYGQKKSKE